MGIVAKPITHYLDQIIEGDCIAALKDLPAASVDVIFADPPYILENIPEIHQWVFQNNLLKESAWLIIEHGPTTKLNELPHFFEQRKI